MTRHPLMDKSLREPANKRFNRAVTELPNAVRDGLASIPEIARQYLVRMEYGSGNLPDALYPWIEDSTAKSAKLDPGVRSGQRVVAGTGAVVTGVRDRFGVGGFVAGIAESYRLRAAQVQNAVAYAAAR